MNFLKELNVYKTHVSKLSSIENTSQTPQEEKEVDIIVNAGSFLVEETEEEEEYILPTSEVFTKAHLCLEQLKSYDNLIQEKLNTIK